MEACASRYPLTVAGTAVDLGQNPAPHSRLSSLAGAPARSFGKGTHPFPRPASMGKRPGCQAAFGSPITKHRHPRVFWHIRPDRLANSEDTTVLLTIDGAPTALLPQTFPSARTLGSQAAFLVAGRRPFFGFCRQRRAMRQGVGLLNFAHFPVIPTFCCATPILSETSRVKLRFASRQALSPL